jgi:hypothetical protein
MKSDPTLVLTAASRSTRRTRRIQSALTVAVAATLAITACGGDEKSTDDADATTSTAESTTTSTAAEETGPDDTVAPADEATRDLAAAAVLQTPDFGDGFTETTPSSEWTPTEDSCAYQEGGPEELLGAGATMNGPTVQLNDQAAYAYSRAYVFPTEADAVAWVGIAATDAWSDCLLESYQELQDDEGTDVQMSAETREDELLGQDGFEAFARFFGRDGSDQVVLDVVKQVYRLGNVVIVTTTEDAVMGNAGRQLDDGRYAALSAAWDRVNATSSGGAPASSGG